jgi:DNA-directed RNA polymerase subunit beta
VRSPSVYYDSEIDKSGKMLYNATVIPNRGAWLEYETDSADCLWVRVDRTRKLPLTVFLRALGFGSDYEITSVLGEDIYLDATFKKDGAASEEEGLVEIYRRLRPGEPPTVESARQLINSLFFDPRRYDLARVGRYKFNKKLSVAMRIKGHISADNIIERETGEIIVMEGDMITDEAAQQIEDCGINEVFLVIEGERVKVLGNNFVKANRYLPFEPMDAGLNEKVHYPTLKSIIKESGGDHKKLLEALKSRINELIPKHIMVDDIIASVSYIIGLKFGIGNEDDIDHLGNRRLRSVGELLQNQIRVFPVWKESCASACPYRIWKWSRPVTSSTYGR